MNHITFIRPPSTLPLETFGSNQGFAPLGMAYLIGALEKAGYNVHAIDAFGEAIHQFSKIENTNLLVNGLTSAEILERVPLVTEALCISCLFSNDWLYTKEIIVQFRKLYPRVPIILGGEHVSADWKTIVQSNISNLYCVRGEGEETLIALLQTLSSNGNLKSVSGISFKDINGELISTPSSKRIRALSEIAWPAWDKIPLENYFRSGFGGSTFNQRSLPMLASRGCPYKCTFCSNPNMWGNNWYPRDIEDLIAEIKLYVQKYEVGHIDFFDLTTIINKSWIISFCQRLIQENLNITWSMPAGTRSEVLDLEVITLLKRSGLRKLDFAPESGSEATLRRIKKKVKLDRMLDSIKICVNHNIPCGATLIYGFPEQTLKECMSNVALAIKLAFIGLNDLPCFPFVPYPGSELFFQLVNQGKIDTSDKRYELFLANNIYTKLSKMKSWSEHIPDFLIPIFVLGTMLLFYLLQFIFHPKRFFQLVHRIFTGKPVTSMELLLYGIKLNFKDGRKLNINSQISLKQLDFLKVA